MSFFHVFFCLSDADLSKLFLFRSVHVDLNFLNTCQNDQFIGICLFCHLSCSQIFFDYGTCSFQAMILFQYRNTASSAGYNNLICIQ